MPFDSFPRQALPRSLRRAVLAGLCGAAITAATLSPLAPSAASAAVTNAASAKILTPRFSILTVYLADSPEHAAALRQYLARPPQERNPSAVLIADPTDASSIAQALAAFRTERGDANVRVVDLRSSETQRQSV